MEETMTEWKDRKRGMDSGLAGAQGLAGSGGPVAIPLGPGEWDEGLGIPMCVVCQGVCGTIPWWTEQTGLTATSTGR